MMATQDRAVTRVRRSASQWQGLVQSWAQSGMSVSSFCERERIGQASLYRWRMMFAGSKSRALRKTEPPAEFLDLGALKSSAPPRPGVELRVDLGDGLSVVISKR